MLEVCSAPLAICHKSSIFSDSGADKEELDLPTEGEALMDIAGEAAPLGVIGAMIGVTAFCSCCAGGAGASPKMVPSSKVTRSWKLKIGNSDFSSASIVQRMVDGPGCSVGGAVVVTVLFPVFFLLSHSF